MLYLSIAFFAVAAVLGLTILLKWLVKKDAPRSVIYSHGIVAASGLVLLIVYALQNPENFPKTSIVFFVVAAIAGFYMFITDLKKKPHPVAVAFVHGLVAVGGVVALLYFILS